MTTGADRVSYLEAVCEGCQKAAEPALSVVWVDLGEAVAIRDAHQPGHGSDEHPFHDDTLAHWRMHHAACRPESVGHIYDIDLQALDLPGGLFAWTRHLSSKTWLQHTDWHALVAFAETQGRLAAWWERAA